MIAFLFACIGAVLGSFVAVVAERLHTGQSWVGDRSRCNSCARTLGFPDLVPVLSWAASAGRCRTCTAKIPGSYVATELALAALFALSYAMLGFGIQLLLLLAILVVLAFIVLYDLRHTVIPRTASLALLVLSIAFAWLLPSFALSLMLAGGIGLAFVLLHVLSGGRAMGLGDAPVALSLSLVAGAVALSGLVFSFWIGALYGIALLALRRGGTTMKSEVPFAPFLALGFLLAFFTGWNVFPLAL